MYRLAVIAVLLCLAAPAGWAQAGGDTNTPSFFAENVSANPKSDPPSDARSQDGPEKGSNEWQGWVAGSIPFRGFETQPLAWIWAAGGGYGRVITDPHGPGFVRGRFEWAFDVVPVLEIVLPHHPVYAPGFDPVVLKWDLLTRRRVSPYVEWSGGAVFGNHEVIPGTTSFNFMPSAAAGVTLPYGHGKYSWSFEARFFHVSNAGLTHYNPGLNTIQVRIGFGLFTHPKR